MFKPTTAWLEHQVRRFKRLQKVTNVYERRAKRIARLPVPVIEKKRKRESTVGTAEPKRKKVHIGGNYIEYLRKMYTLTDIITVCLFTPILLPVHLYISWTDKRDSNKQETLSSAATGEAKDSEGTYALVLQLQSFDSWTKQAVVVIEREGPLGAWEMECPRYDSLREVIDVVKEKSGCIPTYSTQVLERYLLSAGEDTNVEERLPTAALLCTLLKIPDDRQMLMISILDCLIIHGCVQSMAMKRPEGSCVRSCSLIPVFQQAGATFIDIPEHIGTIIGKYFKGICNQEKDDRLQISQMIFVSKWISHAVSVHSYGLASDLPRKTTMLLPLCED